MGRSRRRRQAWMMVVAAAIIVMVSVGAEEERVPVLHKVGGKMGWTYSNQVNYTDWALRQPTFYVGDWLLFVFEKHQYNVLEVNKTSYEECDEGDFLKNITKGGRDVFKLTQPITYYFLSGGGYCYGGMKLSVNVVEFNSSTTQLPHAPVPNNAYFRNTQTQISMYIWIGILIWVLWN